MVHAHTIEDKNARRLLICVALVAGIVILAALSIAAYRSRVIPFDHDKWAADANQFTEENSRFAMAPDVIRRIQDTNPTDDKLRQMLGNPDPDFEVDMTPIKGPGTGGPYSIGGSSGGGMYMYVLGIKPANAVSSRRIEVLNVYMPAKGSGAQTAYVEEIPYPAGAKIIARPSYAKPFITSSGALAIP